MSKTTITADMLIADVIKKIPAAAEIMTSYGLHCTSCSVNAFEPIKDGAMGHGMSEETADEMLAEINKIASTIIRLAPDDGIYLTENAAKKVKEFATAENKTGYGLKITADCSGNYSMDFQEKAEKGEKKFEFHGVEIFLDKESLKNLLGAEIDFLETQFGSGFKIDNPNENKSGGCGSGGCGCGGSGKCGCK